MFAFEDWNHIIGLVHIIYIITVEQVSVVMWLAPRPPVRETRVQIP